MKIFSADPSNRWWEITDYCELECDPIWGGSGNRVYQFPISVEEDFSFRVPIGDDEFVEVGQLDFELYFDGDVENRFDPNVNKYRIVSSQLQYSYGMFSGITLSETKYESFFRASLGLSVVRQESSYLD